MRLIDADALKKTFCAECDHTISCEDCDIDFHFEHLAPTVDVVTWKDFRDFLDDNGEDFESVNKRLKDIEEKLLDAFEQITVTKMMERWESLARKAKVLEGKVKRLEREDSMIWDFFRLIPDVKRVEAIEDRLKAIEEKIEGYVFE